MKIKKGDTVKILIGKDKGKTGKVEKLFPREDRVLIPGINEFKRHVKARQGSAAGPSGQKSEIMTITKPITVSNVAIVCPKCKKVSRIGWKIEKGKKVRICRKCLKTID